MDDLTQQARVGAAPTTHANHLHRTDRPGKRGGCMAQRLAAPTVCAQRTNQYDITISGRTA